MITVWDSNGDKWKWIIPLSTPARVEVEDQFGSEVELFIWDTTDDRVEYIPIRNKARIVE